MPRYRNEQPDTPVTDAYAPGFTGVDCTTKPVIIYLPGAPSVGQIFNVKKIDTTNHKVTINGNGRNIDGVATQPLSSPMQNRTVQFDGTNWFFI